MKRGLRGVVILLLLILTFTTFSCDHNVYLTDSMGLWLVNGKYFSSMQEAMDYIYVTTNGTSRAMGDVPVERTAVLQRDVDDGERGGGLRVPEDFRGQLMFDFNGYTYEFDDSLDHFFDVRGGDEVYITNGTTVIYNEASHIPFALAVNTDVVTIDTHMIDDRRWDPVSNTSDAKLVEVGEKGSLVINSIVESDDADTSTILTGVVSVITDGTSGGKLTIRNSNVNITNVYTKYKDIETNTVLEEIPDTTEIAADARAEIRQEGGKISVQDINKVTDFLEGTTLYPKAILSTVVSETSEKAEIDTPHDNSEVHDAVETIVKSNTESEGVKHDYYHTFGDWVVVTEATCETNGLEKRTCTMEGCTSGEGGVPYFETRVIKAYGHDISDWVTTDPEVHYKECSICHTRFEEGAHSYTDWTYNPETNMNECVCTVCGRMQTSDHIHDAIHHEAVPATCTEDGTIEYWECSVCSRLFSDSECKIEITDTAVPATGHSLTHVAAVAHTCTTDGNTEYWQCTVCGRIFEDEDCTTELTATDIVDPANHDSVTYHAATDNSCTTDGNIGYYQCDVCGKYYSDINCTTELDYDTDIKIPMTGHSYSTEWTHDDTHHWHVCSNGCGIKGSHSTHVWSEWAYDNTTATKTRTCSVCGKTETEGHTHSSSTWTSDDLNHWHVCDECGTVYGSAAHTFSDWVYDSTLDKDKRTCSICGKVITRTHVHGTTEAETLVHTAAVAATCTETGNIEYWHCTLCDRYYTDANCTTQTTLANTVTDALGHSVTIHAEAVAATCTATGNVEYWQCDRCGTCFTERNVNQTTGKVTYSGEVTADGVVTAMIAHTGVYETTETQHRKVCSVCGQVLQAWTNHTWDQGKPCSDGLHLVYTCTACGAIRNASEPEFETYHVAIGTIYVPKLDPSPCGEMVVSKEGTVCTVWYEPHLNSTKEYTITCRYLYNGKWSEYLVADEDGRYTFDANRIFDYIVEMQIYNKGGTIVRRETVKGTGFKF